MEWRLCRAAVSTHAKPHAQQQLARDLEVERAAMGQRCRPQSFGKVQRGNAQPRRWLDFLLTAALLLYRYKKKQSQSLRLDPYVSHREGSIVVLPVANLRGPPDKYGLITLRRPPVRCTPRSGSGVLCLAARFVSAKKATICLLYTSPSPRD